MSEFAPDSVYSILQAFKPILKSIDCRTIAVRVLPDEKWINVVTAIKISRRSIETVISEQNSLPKLKNSEVMVVSKAIPFDFSLFEEIVNGSLIYGRTKVETRKLNLLDFKLNSSFERSKGQDIRKLDLSLRGNKISDLWSILNRNNSEAVRANYHSFDELSRSVSEVWNLGQDTDFLISIFPEITLENGIFNGRSFQIDVRRIGGVKRLQLNFTLERQWRQYGPYQSYWKYIHEITETPDSEGHVKISVSPTDILPFDRLGVELIHTTSALTIGEYWVDAPLKYVAEPFFKTLNAFCSSQDFQKMLLEPEHFGKNPDKIFENAVTWLLSLSGFFTVNLATKIKLPNGKGEKSFDVLSAESGYPSGCSDILAYEDNKRLMLVDCDIGYPDDKKIDRLVATSDYFKSKSKFGALEFIPVLFSPRDCSTVDVQKKKRLVIVDCEIIKLMLRDIATGNRDNARGRIYISSM